MSFSLFLYADQSTDSSVSTENLVTFLSGIEFLKISANEPDYKPGKLLMDYITFLGCSPSLRVGEIDSAIRFFHFDKVSGMGGDSIETIKYPNCKHPVDRPSRLLNNYTDNPGWHCPVCGQEGNTADINWRKSAGFSKFFIEVTQIFPKEAIPSDKLLAALLTYTNTEWKWFYSKSS